MASAGEDTPPEDLEPKHEIGGGYRLVKRLASAGAGEVWKAEAPGGFPVAVKLVFRLVQHDETQRALRGLDLHKELRHAFLLPVLAYWQMDSRLVVVMELADCTLGELGKQTKAESGTGIPVPQLLGYLRDTAEALDYLHGQRVVHRDVKPENILVVGSHAKLGDLTLARKQHEEPSGLVGSIFGTPAYLAPEAWRGQPSRYSDQYGLALSYAELRLDRRVFAAPDLAAIMQRHLKEAPDLEPLPKPEQNVLVKALAKDPAQRYPSCSAFVEALPG